MPVEGGSDPQTPLRSLHCPNQPVGLEAQCKPKRLNFPSWQEQKLWRSWIFQFKLGHLNSSWFLSVQSPRGLLVYLNLVPTFWVCEPELGIYQRWEFAWHFQLVLLLTWPETAYQNCSQYSSISPLGHNESKEMQSRPNKKKMINQTFLDSQKGLGSNPVEM